MQCHDLSAVLYVASAHLPLYRVRITTSTRCHHPSVAMTAQAKATGYVCPHEGSIIPTDLA